MISAPVKARGKTTSLSEFGDLYPTLCELANIDLPKHLEGMSLVPILKDPKTTVKDQVFVTYQNGETVITQDFMYTSFQRGNNDLGEMLYDMNKDPDQNVNIVNKEEYRKTAQKLKSLIR